MHTCDNLKPVLSPASLRAETAKAVGSSPIKLQRRDSLFPLSFFFAAFVCPARERRRRPIETAIIGLREELQRRGETKGSRGKEKGGSSSSLPLALGREFEY